MQKAMDGCSKSGRRKTAAFGGTRRTTDGDRSFDTVWSLRYNDLAEHRTRLEHAGLPVWWNGRHMGLKIPRLRGRAGSSPATGTSPRVSARCITFKSNRGRTHIVSAPVALFFPLQQSQPMLQVCCCFYIFIARSRMLSIVLAKLLIPAESRSLRIASSQASFNFMVY